MKAIDVLYRLHKLNSVL